MFFRTLKAHIQVAGRKSRSTGIPKKHVIWGPKIGGLYLEESGVSIVAKMDP